MRKHTLHRSGWGYEYRGVWLEKNTNPHCFPGLRWAVRDRSMCAHSCTLRGLLAEIDAKLDGRHGDGDTPDLSENTAK